jgi:D-glycero-alpha-D-manno-heptose-7-phosphate kinase
MYALEGRMISKEDLCRKAIHIGQNLIKENVGSQDQTFASYGGFNYIEFLQSGEVVVVPVITPRNRIEELKDNLVLVYTGLSRTASLIAKEQIKKTKVNVPYLGEMKQVVDEAYKIICSPSSDLNEFGKLLNVTWQIKKKLSKAISSPVIDELYEKMIK